MYFATTNNNQNEVFGSSNFYWDDSDEIGQYDKNGNFRLTPLEEPEARNKEVPSSNVNVTFSQRVVAKVADAFTYFSGLIRTFLEGVKTLVNRVAQCVTPKKMIVEVTLKQVRF